MDRRSFIAKLIGSTSLLLVPSLDLERIFYKPKLMVPNTKIQPYRNEEGCLVFPPGEWFIDEDVYIVRGITKYIELHKDTIIHQSTCKNQHTLHIHGNRIYRDIDFTEGSLVYRMLPGYTAEIEKEFEYTLSSSVPYPNTKLISRMDWREVCNNGNEDTDIQR
jgi:hypothetical protein